MSGVQSLLGSLYHSCYGDPADYDFYLHLRKQSRIHFNTTIHLAGTLLYATAHDLCHGHTGYTQIVQCFLQYFEPGELCNNHYFVDSGCGNCCRSCLYFYCCFLHGCGSCVIITYAKAGIFIYLHGHSVGNIHNTEACICGRKTMLAGIQTYNFLFLRYA